MFKLKFSAASAIGSRRENQDNLLVNGVLPMDPVEENGCSLKGEADPDKEGGCLFAVFDGVGSTPEASSAAMYAASYMQKQKHLLSEDASPNEWFAETFDRIDADLTEEYNRTSLLGACTVTALYIKNGRYYFANLGDSPAFLIQNGQVLELSQRHNLKAIKERYNAAMGFVPGDVGYQIEEPKDKRTLKYYLGNCRAYPSEKLFYAEGEIQRKQTFILCSDGITNAFPEHALLSFSRLRVNAEEIAAYSAEAPNADNCTCILIRIC